MSIESLMPSNHLILYRPLLLPSIFPNITVFSNESVLHIRWPKYWTSSSTSVLPMNSQDWFPLEWTDLISLLPKGLSTVFSSITVWKHQFWCSGFLMVQLSHLKMTTGKTIALTIWTFALVCISSSLHSREVLTWTPTYTTRSEGSERVTLWLHHIGWAGNPS